MVPTPDDLARVGRAYLALIEAERETRREGALWNSASSGHRKYWETFLTAADREALRQSVLAAERRERAARQALDEAVDALLAKGRTC